MKMDDDEHDRRLSGLQSFCRSHPVQGALLSFAMTAGATAMPLRDARMLHLGVSALPAAFAYVMWRRGGPLWRRYPPDTDEPPAPR